MPRKKIPKKLNRHFKRKKKENVINLGSKNAKEQKKRRPLFWLENLFLFLILVSTLFLRIYKVAEIPPSLNWDEISHAYNAYSLFKTGKDEWGVSWPLIFRAYGDYKLPLYIYLTAPLVGFWGINALTVRLVSILAGVGLVFVAYLITQKLFNDERTALLAALLTAISPWSLFVSRAALEANLAAFLFSLAVFFCLKWLDDFGEKWLVWAAFFFGLSFYAYNSARILTPLFLLLVLAIIIRKKVSFKALIIPFLLLLIAVFPLVGQFWNKSAIARFGLVSLVDQGMINRIILARQESKLPPLLVRAFYNRPTFFLVSAAQNYISNFSPFYLFFQGGSHYQFSLPDHELLYLVTAPFLLLGMIKAIFKGSTAERLMVFWFWAAIIPSAITKDAPHVLRTLLILPSPMILTALGLKVTGNFLKKGSFLGGKLLAGIFVFAVLFSFWRWWQDYQTLYPQVYSWAWQYGYREAVLFIKQHYSEYDQIFITKRYGEPHEFLLAYYPWEPAKYQTDQTKVWNYHANWYWIDGFDKFHFYNDWEFSNLKCRENCLLIASPGNYPEGWSKIKTISFLDGKPAFEILEQNQKVISDQ